MSVLPKSELSLADRLWLATLWRDKHTWDIGEKFATEVVCKEYDIPIALLYKLPIRIKDKKRRWETKNIQHYTRSEIEKVISDYVFKILGE